MKLESKWMITSLAAATLLSATASAQTTPAQTTPPQYSVLDLGLVGAAGAPWSIANNGLAAGVVVTPDNKSQGVVWFQGLEFALGASALGGLNSEANAIGLNGQIVGAAQTTAANGDDFCGFTSMGLSESANFARTSVSHSSLFNRAELTGPVTFQDARFGVLNLGEGDNSIIWPSGDFTWEFGGMSYGRITVEWEKFARHIPEGNLQPYVELERAFRAAADDRNADKIYLCRRVQEQRILRGLILGRLVGPHFVNLPNGWNNWSYALSLISASPHIGCSP